MIVSAGIHTPTLLEVSGVGNASHIGPILQTIGRPVVSNVPGVGSHLQNDPLVFFIISRNTSDPVSSNPGDAYAGGAFTANPASTNPSAEPRFSQWIGIDINPAIYALAIGQLGCRSQGFAHIQSPDPLCPVLASDSLFSNPQDMDDFVAVIQNYFVRTMTNLSAIDPSYQLLAPPLAMITNPDTTALRAWIGGTIIRAHHWQSQCNMGPYEDNGVVDHRGHVYGTEHLILADATIVPRKTNSKADGNTQSVSYVIGHIIAKKILEGTA